MPRAFASCLASSVLPTPVGPAKRKQPMGFSGSRRPERASLMAPATASHAASWPKIWPLRAPSSVRQGLAVVRAHRVDGHPRHAGHHGLDLGGAHLLRPRLLRQQLLGGPGLVHHVERAVRQPSVRQVLGSQAHGGLQGLVRVLHAVVRFVGRLQALEHAQGIFRGRLVHLHHLEAPGQRAIPVQGALQILEGGGADAAQLAGREGGLQQVGGVHGAAAGGARAHQGVQLIHEEDGAGFVIQGLEHGLEAFLEIAPVAAAGEQGPQIQGEDPRVP